MTNKLTDEQVAEIKTGFAQTLSTALFTDAEEQQAINGHLKHIANEDNNVSEFIQTLGGQVLDLAENIKNGGLAPTLTTFICQGIRFEEGSVDEDTSHYHLLVDNTASLNTVKRNVSGTTPTSVDVSKMLNVIKTTGDSPFAILWLNSVQAIILVGGETEAAGIATFRDNGLYDIMYTNPELGKVHSLIIAMAEEDQVRFKIVELRKPLNDQTVDNLTLEAFKQHATTSNEIYLNAIETGAEPKDALLSAGIEGWANNEGIDLTATRLHIPNLSELRDYVDQIVQGYDTVAEDVQHTEQQDNGVISDAEIVEEAPDTSYTVETKEGRRITYTKRSSSTTLINNIYKCIDNIISDDGRLVSLVSNTEQNPRTNFVNLVVNRVNALSVLNEEGRNLASAIANEVFGTLLPHLDEILSAHNSKLKDTYIVPTPEVVNTIANENKLHSRGLSALTEEQQTVVYETIAELPAMAKYEKDYDDEFKAAVIDSLNRIAPFEYNAEVLTNGVMLNQLIVSGDEKGDAYRGTYVRNVLLEEYTKLNGSDLKISEELVRELAGTGSSSALFEMAGETLMGLTTALSTPRTYTVIGGIVVLLVSELIQENEEVDGETTSRTIYLYSVANKGHANNIVIVKTGKENPVYTLTSSTTYEGVADVAEYVKSILI